MWYFAAQWPKSGGRLQEVANIRKLPMSCASITINHSKFNGTIRRLLGNGDKMVGSGSTKSPPAPFGLKAPKTIGSPGCVPWDATNRFE